MASGLLCTLLLCVLAAGTTASHGENEEVEEQEQQQLSPRSFYRCNRGWSRYENRCYRYYNLDRRWNEAEEYCTNNNAHLASIPSVAVYNFIRDLVHEAEGTDVPCWVGGNDIEEEGTWVWSDGSSYNFDDLNLWGRNQPSNNNNEDCMEINSRGRNDVNDRKCKTKLHFVCAQDL